MSSGSNEQDLTPDPDFRPQDVRLIGDVESLRAISDPTRIRILETMVQRQDPPWSVKELAAALGGPADPALPPRRAAARARPRPGGRASRRVRDHRDPLSRGRALVPARPRGCSPATRTRPAAGAPRHPRRRLRHRPRRDRGRRSAAGAIDPSAEAPDERAGRRCRAASPGSRPARAAELRTRLQALLRGVRRRRRSRRPGLRHRLRPLSHAAPEWRRGNRHRRRSAEERPADVAAPRPDRRRATSSASPTSAASTSPRRSPTSATG